MLGFVSCLPVIVVPVDVSTARFEAKLDRFAMKADRGRTRTTSVLGVLPARESFCATTAVFI